MHLPQSSALRPLMTKVRQGGIFGSSTLVLLLLTAPALAADQETWLRFGGRLHPLIVHFPIALISVAGICELWAMLRSRSLSPMALSCLGFAWVFGALAAGAGWLYAEHEGVSDSLADTLYWHRWGGIAVIGLSLVVWVVGLVARKRQQSAVFFRIGLFAAVLGVAWIGHLGGDMTRGDDYLFELFDEPEDGMSDDVTNVANTFDPLARAGTALIDEGGNAAGAALPVNYENQVKPIFARHCFKCHGPKKRKGNLRLDSKKQLFHTAKGKWVVKPGHADNSLLIRRLELPVTHRKFMPKKTGKRIPADEIALLRRWINEGARYAPGTVVQTPKVVPGSGTGEKKPEATKLRRTPAIDQQLAALREQGVAIQYVAAAEAEVDANFSVMASRFSVEDLKGLAGLEDRLLRLDLKKTNLDDAGLALLAGFERLEYLNLSETKISDEGLSALSKMKKLKSLNLWGTAISDAGLRHLEGLTALRSLYLWKSKATPQGAKALQATLGDLKIDMGGALKR
ncbi:MAG: DUF2231 domain-containing protein [Planctomycetota bacterium]